MKTLLIQPPIRDFYQTSVRTQPIGLAYLAAALRAGGHEVELLDCRTETRKPIPIPAELSYLRDFYPFHDRSPFKLFTGYYHFGMGWNEIRERIVGSKAEVFGISSSFTPYHAEAVKIAQIIKEWDEHKVTILGGAHVSCDPEGVLKSPSVDYVVLGEGEWRLPSLLDRIRKGRIPKVDDLDGIGYRVNGKTRVNPLSTFIEDLDRLPHPARDLLDPDRYRAEMKRSTMIITSRGCPHGCAYCSSHLIMGGSFRARSPEAVLREMVDCQKRLGIQIFDIEDDNFTFDKERAKRLMKLVIEAFGDQTGQATAGVELTAMNGISFASLDGELLKLMKKAGFQAINLSFVSSEASTKERLKRPSPVIDFDRILQEAERVGFRVVAYGIFGMPGQSLEEMVKTVIYLMGKRVLIGPSVYYPTPGTSLFFRCKKDGSLPPHSSQWRSSAFPIETEDFNRVDMVTLLRLVRAVNFIKGKMDTRVLREGMTLKELFQTLQRERRTDLPEPCSVPSLRNVSGGKPYAPCDPKDIAPWVDLLLLLPREKAFFSLRKGSPGHLSFVKEKSSKRILDYFFEMAWDRPIVKSRP